VDVLLRSDLHPYYSSQAIVLLLWGVRIKKNDVYLEVKTSLNSSQFRDLFSLYYTHLNWVRRKFIFLFTLTYLPIIWFLFCYISLLVWFHCYIYEHVFVKEKVHQYGTNVTCWMKYNLEILWKWAWLVNLHTIQWPPKGLTNTGRD
jgi:hypothetical protein